MGIKFLRNVHIDDPYIFCFKCFGGLYDLCSSLKFYSYVMDALLVTLGSFDVFYYDTFFYDTC